MDPLAFGFEKLAYKRGSCCFSVRTGNSVGLAGTEIKKGLHFRSDHNTLSSGLGELFVVVVHSGSAEYDIAFHYLIEITLAKCEIGPS